MKNIVGELTAHFRAQRRAAKRYTAMLLVLALVTTLFVNWWLHRVGISMTGENYQCGEQEHTHTASCYEKVLVCGYVEGEVEDWNATMPSDDMLIDPDFGVDAEDEEVALYAQPETILVAHTHTEECYTAVQTLTCLEEEHVHDDDCFDPEDGSLVCSKFEHTHDDSCYTTSYELTCGLDEGELVEEPNPDYDAVAAYSDEAAQPVEDDTTQYAPTEPPVHHHTDACYAEELICPFPEHHHTVACLADPLADVETEEEWLAKTDTSLSGQWGADLLTVAKSQLGYEQSEKNFQLDTEDEETVRHYTRYGQWYGNPYGAWDVMFLSYCLHYADVPQSVVAQRAGTLALRSDMKDSAWLRTAADAALQAGDIVFYNTADGTETVGIVEAADADTSALTVISGAVDGKVAEVALHTADVTGVIALNAACAAQNAAAKPDTGAGTLAEDEETAATVEWVGEVPLTSSAAVYAAGDIPLTNDMINKVTFQKKVNGVWTDLAAGDTITSGTELQFILEYSLPQNTLSSGRDTLQYQLPAGLGSISAVTDGKIVEKSTTPGQADLEVGTYTISTTGEVRLTFKNAQYLAGAPFTGTFKFTAKANYTGTEDSSEIKFKDGFTLTIKKPDPDVAIKKTAQSGKSFIETLDDGRVRFNFDVTVSTTNGTVDPVTIVDKLNFGNTDNGLRLADGVYEADSIQLYRVAADGTMTLQDLSTLKSEQKYELKNGTSDKPRTITLTDLPALDAGEKYLLRYSVLLPQTGFGTVAENPSGTAQLRNRAEVTSGKLTAGYNEKATMDRQRIQKEAELDADTGLITWTITVQTPNKSIAGSFLKDYVVKDLVPDNVEIVGDVKVNGKVPKNADGTAVTDWKTFLEGGYTLPGDSNAYTITYQTTTPSGGGTVTNKATATNKDGYTYTASKTVTVGRGSWTIAKKHLRTDGDVAYWSITATNQAGESGFVLEDTLGNAVDENGQTIANTHYAYASELQQAIEKNLSLLLYDRTTADYAAAKQHLTITYYGAGGQVVQSTDSTTPVYRFTIAVAKYDGNPVRRIALTDLPTHEDRANTPGGSTWTYRNTATIVQDTEKDSSIAEDEYRRYESFEKQVSVKGDNDDYYTDEDNPIKYDSVSGKKLHYRLLLTTAAGDSDDIIITDTLPKNTTYNPNDTDVYLDEVELDKKTGGWTAECDADGVLHITISGYNTDGKAHQIKIHYSVSISNDPNWKDLAASEIIYTNYAEWGTLHAETSTTVTKDVNPLTKTGEQLYVNNQPTNRVRYTVFVNPGKVDLSQYGDGAQTILLEDKLSASAGATAHGDLTTVKLYYYEFVDGQIQYTQEVPVYRILEPTADSWLRIELQNTTPFVLVYECEIDPGNAAGDPKMDNEVTLSSKYHSSGNTVTFSQSSQATTSMGKLTLNKKDSYSGKLLPGATFAIQQYDQTTKSWTDWSDGTRTTDENGQLNLYITADINAETLKPNTLYRFVETIAPTNYNVDSTPRYFLFYDTEEAAAWKAATGCEASEALLVEGASIALSDVTRGSTRTVTSVDVTNVYNQLTVTKYWFDGITKLPTTPEVDDVEVQLYYYLEDETAADKKPVGALVMLNAANNWSHTWAGNTEIPAELDGKKCYYLVEEVTTGSWNVVIQNNDGVQTGEIAVMNYVCGMELPSTGGSGTAPFTLLGGLTAAAAALVLLRRRRKNA